MKLTFSNGALLSLRINNYLSDLGQRTLANNTRSDRCSRDFGVSQGSILGSLFFILYVNDFQQALTNVNIQSCVDDKVLHLFSSNLSFLKKNLQTNLNELSNWCQANELTLNPNMTKMMAFGTRHLVRKAKKCQLWLGGLEIKKYLLLSTSDLFLTRPCPSRIM